MAGIYGTNTGNMLQAGGTEFKDYVKNNLNQDPKGNNELGNTLRRGGFGLTPDFLQRVGFVNEIGPQRIQSLRDLISRFSPGNVQGVADQNRALLQQQANRQAMMQSARLRGMGASTAATQGAALAARNQGVQAANAYQNQLYSPQGQNDILQLLMNAYGQAEDLNLDDIMAIFGGIEQRHQQNQMERQQGGFGGLGQALGLITGGADILGQLGGQRFSPRTAGARAPGTY
jgi:hypothetical protein